MKIFAWYHKSILGYNLSQNGKCCQNTNIARRHKIQAFFPHSFKQAIPLKQSLNPRQDVVYVLIKKNCEHIYIQAIKSAAGGSHAISVRSIQPSNHPSSVHSLGKQSIFRCVPRWGWALLYGRAQMRHVSVKLSEASRAMATRTRNEKYWRGRKSDFFFSAASPQFA